MFSPDIVCSDEFLEMPPSTQTLYFHLGMKADDDGFIQPKMIMRILGSAEDDLKILIAKRFLIPFETGVVVIKHWLIHNMIRQDRYKATRFVEEKKSLKIKENNAYTELKKSNWQPNGNQSAPQVRLGKDSIGKVKLNTCEPSDSRIPEVIKLFEEVNPSISKYYGNTTQRKACERLLKKWSVEQIKAVVAILPELNATPYAKGKSITPHQLEENLGFIKAFIDQKKTKKRKIAVI